MPILKNAEGAAFDYVSAYEKAMRDVVQACGSREAANEMLDELHDHYEKTGVELRRLKRLYGDKPEAHAAKKAALLARARQEVNEIIEKHAPHTGDHVKELILGTSLAATAILLPVSYAVSTLAVATSIVAIGSSYYIGFKLLNNWKAISGKERIASMAGRVGPKHIGAEKKVGKWMPHRS